MEEDKNIYGNLQTDNLLLREVKEEDALDLYEGVFGNFEYYKYYYAKPFTSFEEYEELVKKYKELYKRGNYFRWGIVLKETDKMIGSILIHSKDFDNKIVKIGYVISQDYAIKGYATEVVNKIVEFCFQEMGIHRIECEMVEANLQSEKVAIKCGMKFESVREDSYFLEDEFYNKKVYVKLNKDGKGFRSK